MTLFAPTRRLCAITDLPISQLVEAGIRCILVDRDNTCVPRDTGVAPAEVLAWLETARAAGMKTCMVSNNFHSRDVEASAEELGLLCVHHAMKPAPFAVRRALRLCGAAPEEAVLVGDQVFTDVVAGNLAGVMTVLVDPQSTSDLWYTHIFRIFERAIGADRGKEAPVPDAQPGANPASRRAEGEPGDRTC